MMGLLELVQQLGVAVLEKIGAVGASLLDVAKTIIS